MASITCLARHCEHDVSRVLWGPSHTHGFILKRRGQVRHLGNVGSLTLIGAIALIPNHALAHVKWFAPYIVGAPPAPVTSTLRDAWFWVGIAIVLSFFVMARFTEASRYGGAVLDTLDRLTDPLWQRLDDYVRAIVAAFFVAIFSVGGIYPTPDLKTPSEWVSWVQLLIAAAIFWKATMPFGAAGIVALWLLALRDYDLFHLLD